ncbi:hypothetical protein [Streptomyces nitrosporeus]|uniref:hypothetical protein n=1 Tax=Streptomyces nitrosporeus TaxID=28894 RepID=UPI00123D7DBE|nr:hypothetical protein [Streptomyces nitrosporeus]
MGKNADEREPGSWAACVSAAGLSRRRVSAWCQGRSAPLRTSTPAVKVLVTSLRLKAGEPAEFDAEWARALEAAQREGEGRRGVPSSWAGPGGVKSDTSRQARAAALAAMRDFACDPAPDAPSYLWWQAPQWAGKSTLLGDFVSRPPAGVDIVFCPLDPVRGTDRAEGFVTCVAKELMGLLGVRKPFPRQGFSPAGLQALFRRAAARERRLLLVVDGLDEDAAWSGGPPGARKPDASIASLLPHVPLPASGRAAESAVRVIVSSRPAKRPPSDVPKSHPLRKRRYVRVLPPLVGDEDVRYIAGVELGRLRETPLGCTVAGLLAMAETTLRAEELAELAGVDRAEIDRLLKSARGRCLVPDRAGTDTGAYVLGHSELLRAAKELSGSALLEDCTGRLHAWAERWQRQGWPEATPGYLLSHYPRLLRDAGRTERVVLDPRRQLRLVASGRLDEALAQLGRVPTAGGEEVGARAGVALSRAALSGRARFEPGGFPRLFALAGDASRACALACSAPDGAVAALRLAQVAEVLSVQRREEAEKAGEEAVVRARRFFASVPDGTADLSEKAGELLRAGLVLRGCGQREAGLSVLYAVADHAAAGWDSRMRAIEVLDQEGRADGETDGPLGRVMEHAEALSWGTFAEQAEALEIWAHMVADGTGARDRVEAFCAGLDPASDLTHVDLLALGAGALASVRPDSAGELALRARRALLGAFTDPETRSPADRGHLRLELSTTLARVVAALRETGHGERAGEVLELVPDGLLLDVLGDDVREPARDVMGRAVGDGPGEPPPGEDLFEEIEAALRKDPVAGRELLTAAFARREKDAAVANTQGWGLPLAEALARAGRSDEAARLAKRSREPAGLAGALAVVSTGCAVGGDSVGAVRLARSAAGMAASADDPAVRSLVAQAFAYAGDADAAEEWLGPRNPSGKKPRKAVPVGNAAATGPVLPGLRATGRLMEERAGELGRLARLPYLRGRALPGLVDLLLALPDLTEHGAAVCAALGAACARPEEDLRGWDAHSVLLNGLLAASGCCHTVPPMRDNLSRWEHSMATTPLPPGVLPVAEWAVLHAFRGDARGMRRTAERAETSEERSAALAAVATYLAKVPVVLPVADGWAPQRTSVLRFLALADALGADSSRDEEEARRLACEVLAGEHWRYALPLLPRLAPDALPRLAELALAHTAGATG